MKKTFKDKNLISSIFDNVDLSNSHISGSNLSNVVVEGCKITDLKINGIDIKKLIEKELDRKDKTRSALKIKNIYDVKSVQITMKRFEKVRKQFQKLLLKTSKKTLIQAPTANQWSPVEHVRHLLLSEDIRINYWILRNNLPLSKYGLLPNHIKKEGKFAEVGDIISTNIMKIIYELNKIHAITMKYVNNLTDKDLKKSTKDIDMGQGDVAHVLQDMMIHELEHIRQVEKII